jgi:hypothetical protein
MVLARSRSTRLIAPFAAVVLLATACRGEEAPQIETAGVEAGEVVQTVAAAQLERLTGPGGVRGRRAGCGRGERCARGW